ncbi:uncharacterized protein LOC142986599 [Anticarsia gemmatalis]|uniref:uncharacterized protein LOC142986599 n=1 Tax=Anticarsia gemmatalis TaxID=129554 RepID=UPI003F777724
MTTSTSHLVQVPRLNDVRRESVQACGPWQWPIGARALNTTTARLNKMGFETFVILLFIGTCVSAPYDEPIRIDLPVYDQPQISTDLLLESELKPENYPGGEPIQKAQSNGGNFLTYKLEAANNLLGSSLNAKANSLSEGGIFSAPVTTRESALQEVEGYGSKTLSVKENLEGYVAGIFQPKPIVDTISESEKYGNTGDKFYTAGKAIVGGAAGFSNFVNSVLEVPGSIFRSITRAATEKLNNLGGKLIGL